ncbi:hypothetical protein D9756_011379 [Leucocoprinus leucothites]|uniref:Reverse transcriptase Ty1/copia-type domain-containing protein n=1 Tax=Leucocoprinus leucothites TaxID=201217 RepID=A0A8H5CPD1_9AGAR|nr:hypothetical protein D9756_011379 [Leucoagaricus leucothites]
MTVEEVEDEKGPGEEKEIPEPVEASVGDETTKTVSLDRDPVTYKEAMARPNAFEWRKAMAEELEEFTRKELFTEVARPKNHHVVGCKWVFKRKLDADGQVECYKARLVTQGFSQVEGIDYNETYAPVTKHATIRTLLAFAVKHQWYIHQMDAKAAFLNGDLDEKIYMKIPPGAKETDGLIW